MTMAVAAPRQRKNLINATKLPLILINIHASKWSSNGHWLGQEFTALWLEIVTVMRISTVCIGWIEYVKNICEIILSFKNNMSQLNDRENNEIIPKLMKMLPQWQPPHSWSIIPC